MKKLVLLAVCLFTSFAFLVAQEQDAQKEKGLIKEVIQSAYVDGLCKVLDGLTIKGLVALRPLSFILALYDGVLVDHKRWVPTEIYATQDAYSRYKIDARGRLIKKRKKDI